MKRSRSAANHAPVGRRRENTRQRLVSLEGARGFFSGRVLDYRTPCTASAGRTCQIVADISLWNEFLLPMDLELRELPHTDRRLALESVFHALQWQEWRHERDRLQYRRAATALYWLLKTHHCVATIRIPCTMSDFSTSLLCEALHENTSIKSLSLRDWLRIIPERLWKLVLSMKHLEKLECPYQCTEYTGIISALLQTTQTLTVLHLMGMNESLSQPFLAALKANTTLRVLSMASTAIKGDPDLFAEILSDSNTLQDLTVTWGPYCHPSEVKSVFRGMLKNKSILSLRIHSIVLDVEGVELAAQVFTENKALRRFHWSLYSLYPKFMPFSLHGASPVSPIPVPANTFVWQEAIAHNTALEDLELPFNTWCAEHWESFFGVLSTHATLKTITIVAGVEQCNVLSPVVKALERTGTASKVLLKAPGDANILALPDGNCCSKLYTILWDTPSHGVLPVLQQLSTFSHLKELSVKFRFWDNECCTVVLEYVAATSMLQKLDMDIRVFEDPMEPVQWLQGLSKSLLHNRSITELGIFGYFEIGEGLGELGETVSRSNTIRKFRLHSYPGNFALEAFIRGLRVNIFDNYALCSVMFGSEPLSDDLAACWFDVKDTARRNCGLVVRAARFVKNRRPDRSCAAALETVSHHPALVAELAEVLSIGVEEASAMVRHRSQSMQDLHEFMRLAGVVRQWVTCHPREEGSKQLDTLDDYCWRHVRQYLHLDDVIGDLTSPVIP